MGNQLTNQIEGINEVQTQKSQQLQSMHEKLQTELFTVNQYHEKKNHQLLDKLQQKSQELTTNLEKKHVELKEFLD